MTDILNDVEISIPNHVEYEILLLLACIFDLVKIIRCSYEHLALMGTALRS